MMRLQGFKYHELKPFLKFKSYSFSDNGNIRVEFKPYNGKNYYHWLNDSEKILFLMALEKNPNKYMKTE